MKIWKKPFKMYDALLKNCWNIQYYLDSPIGPKTLKLQVYLGYTNDFAHTAPSKGSERGKP